MTTTSTRRDSLYGLLVATIAFITYANSLGNGFVGDDHSVILNNPVLRGTILSLFTSADSTSPTELLPFYRPVTYLTFLLEGKLHGFNPLYVRLFNVLLHSANALLVYRLARTLFNQQYAAMTVGLLFALHPLHTEGVNFNSGGRNTMLACFFVLLTYLCHRNAVRLNSLPRACAGGLLFLTGLFSKELTLALAPFILVLEMPTLRSQETGVRKQSVLRLFPYLVATVLYLLMRWLTLSRLGIQTSIVPGSGTQTLQTIYTIPGLFERLGNNIYIIPQYLKSVLWPLALSPRYIVPPTFTSMAGSLLAAWLTITAIAVWLITKGRSKITLFGIGWLVVFWLPVSGILYFSNNQLADRFLYVPAIGLWLIIVDQITRLMPLDNRTVRNTLTVIGGAILLILATLTVNRNRDWKSDFTLYGKLVAQYPNNPIGHANLGSAYIDRRAEGDLPLAQREFETALSLDPTQRTIHTPLGYIALTSGDFPKALHHYNEALTVTPADRDARINRGIVLEKLGRPQEAAADYRFFLSLPDYQNLPGAREYAEQRLRELSPGN